MVNFFSTCYLCLLLVSTAAAQTVVTSNIVRNTTWTKQGNPYLISAYIEIGPNVILDIAPGVVIEFQPLGEVFVYGYLRCAGTLADKVIFSGNQAQADQPNREYIVLKGAGRLSMRYAEVADFTIFTAVDNATALIELSDCSFINNVTSFFGKDGIIDASRCLFVQNTSFAIAQSQIALRDCIFDSCATGLNRVSGTIQRTTFSNNRIGIDGAKNLNLIQNIFQKNTSTAIRITDNTMSTRIIDNILENNQDGIDLKGRYEGNLLVENNKFCNTRYNIITHVDSMINLKNNCWCDSDSAKVIKQISTPPGGSVSFIPFAERCRPCFSQAGNDTSVCAGALIKLGSPYRQPGYTYQWLTDTSIIGVNEPTLTVTPKTDTVFPYNAIYILQSNSPGLKCATDTIVLTVLDKSDKSCRTCVVYAGPDIDICGSKDTVLGLPSNNKYLSYTWYPLEGLTGANGSTARYTAINNSQQPLQKQFVLKAEDKEAGCTSSDTVMVWIQPRYSNNCERFPTIHVYNVITPNDDTDNEVFYIENINFYPQNKVSVYNRWGNVVFQESNYHNTWKGDHLPEGVYYYMLQIPESGEKYTGELYIKK